MLVNVDTRPHKNGKNVNVRLSHMLFTASHLSWSSQELAKTAVVQKPDYRRGVDLRPREVLVSQSANAKPLFTDLAHVAFAAADVELTLAFYEKLGIREAFRLSHDDGSLMLIYLHIGGDHFIEVFPGGPPPEPERQGSFMHLCLLTENLLETVAELRTAGVPIDREPTPGLDGNLQAWLHDPDSNAIELMELTPDSPQRRVARGEKPEIERLEADNPGEGFG